MVCCRCFSQGVNPRTHTPVRTTVMTGIVMAIMAGLIPLGVLAELVNIGTLAAFVLVCCGVMMLRRTHPDMHRPFRAPLGDLFALMGALSCSALIAFLPWETHLRFIVWLAVGLLIYFGYSRRNSKLAGQAAAVSRTLTWAERTEHLGMVRNSQNQHQGHSGFGTGFGIAALVVAILAIFVPVVGIFVSGVALVLAALAALAGDRVFAVGYPADCRRQHVPLEPDYVGCFGKRRLFHNGRSSVPCSSIARDCSQCERQNRAK